VSLPLLAVLMSGACGDGSTGPGGGDGELTIALTDGPGDLAAAFITIDRITLIGRTDAGESGVFEFTPAVTGYISLLDLAGGAALALVDGEAVPSGQYTEMRVYLGDAYVELADGRVFATSGAELPEGVTADGTLKCPSCSQSGFKVKFMNGGLVIDADESTSVLLDFDAGQSFGHEAGNSGKWVMNPVLRATTNSVQFGGLTGTVTLAQDVTLPVCGGAQFELTDFTPIVTLDGDSYSGVIGSDGTLTFATLVPGTYTLPTTGTVTFSNGDTLALGLAPTPATVTITDWGEAATADLAVTSAVCTLATP